MSSLFHLYFIFLLYIIGSEPTPVLWFHADDAVADQSSFSWTSRSPNSVTTTSPSSLPLLFPLPNGHHAVFFPSPSSCLSLASYSFNSSAPSWSFSAVATAAISGLGGGYIFGTTGSNASPAIITTYNDVDFEYYGCSGLCQRLVLADTGFAGKVFHHLVVIKDRASNYISGYFDGALVFNTTITEDINFFQVGSIGCATPPSVSTAEQAAVADLRFFDIAISPSDVSQLYSEFSSTYAGYGIQTTPTQTCATPGVINYPYCNLVDACQTKGYLSIDPSSTVDFMFSTNYTSPYFTVEFWVSFLPDSGTYTFLSTSEWQVTVSSGAVYVEFATDTSADITPFTNPRQSSWTHLAFSLGENGFYQFFVNGLLARSNAFLPPFNVTTGTQIALARSLKCGGCNPYTGLLDNVRVWNKTFTQEEVVQSMSKDITKPTSGLIASFDFNSDFRITSDTRIDLVATVTGSATPTFSPRPGAIALPCDVSYCSTNLTNGNAECGECPNGKSAYGGCYGSCSSSCDCADSYCCYDNECRRCSEVGATCTGDQECKEGQCCGLDGLCTSKCELPLSACNDTSQCAPGTCCYTGVCYGNVLLCPSQQFNQSCTGDFNCFSARCVSNLCGCVADSECNNSDYFCSLETYSCIPKLSLGMECNANAQCSSGACEYGVCQCTVDADCPQYHSCNPYSCGTNSTCQKLNCPANTVGEYPDCSDDQCANSPGSLKLQTNSFCSFFEFQSVSSLDFYGSGFSISIWVYHLASGLTDYSYMADRAGNWIFGYDSSGCLNFKYQGTWYFSGGTCVVPTIDQWSNFILSISPNSTELIYGVDSKLISGLVPIVSLDSILPIILGQNGATIDVFYMDKVYIYRIPLSQTDLYSTTYSPLEDTSVWNAVIEFDSSFLVRQSLLDTVITFSTKGTNIAITEYMGDLLPCALQSDCTYNATEMQKTCSACPNNFFGNGYEYCAVVSDIGQFDYRYLLDTSSIAVYSQWHFNLSSGSTIAADKYNRNNLTLTSVTSKTCESILDYDDATASNAAYFTGLSSAKSSISPLDVTPANDFAFAFMFKPESYGVIFAAAGPTGGFQMYISYSSGSVQWFIGDGTNFYKVATILCSANTWHQIIFGNNFNGGLFFYFDGLNVEVDPRAIRLLVWNTDPSFKPNIIGFGYNIMASLSNSFTGLISECAYWNVALTQEYILRVAYAFTANLKASTMQVFFTEDQPICNGAAGTLYASMNGIGPYEYYWDGNTTASAYSLTTSEYISHTATVKDTFTQCSKSASIELLAGPQVMQIQSNTSDSYCGANNGMIEAQISGGNGPYTYSWVGSSSTQASAYNLSGGQYFVNVVDTSGCKLSWQYYINDRNFYPYIASNSPISCHGGNGQLRAIAEGGSGYYSYKWSNGQQTSEVVVKSGTYSVEVTDINYGCSIKTANYTLEEPDVLSANLSITSPSCGACADGTIIAVVTGGTGLYIYSWTNGAKSSAMTDKSGQYNLTVTDGNACSSVFAGVIPLFITSSGAASTIGPTTTTVATSTTTTSRTADTTTTTGSTGTTTSTTSGTTAGTTSAITTGTTAETTKASTVTLSTSTSGSVTTGSSSTTGLTSTTSSTTGGAVPSLLRAAFSSNGSNIVVVFSAATNMGGLSLSTSFNCGRILNSASSSIVGKSASCQWTTRITLTVTLSSDATVVPGDLLGVLENSIYGVSGIGAAVTGSIFVSYPENGDVPVVNMIAPAQVGSCDSLTLAATVRGSLGRSTSNVWSVSALPVPEDLERMTNTLKSAQGLSLTLTKEFLIAGFTYNFTLTVRNFFNLSSRATVSISRSSFNIPTITIEGPTSITTLASKSISLKGDIIVSDCVPTTPVAWKWTVTRVSTGAYVSLNSTSTRSLIIPANSLSAGENYTITLIGKYSALLNNSASVLVAVPHSQLVASITGGSTRTIAFSQPLVVNATGSYDPDSPKQQLNTVWSCLLADSTTCTDKSGSSLSLGAGYVQSFAASSLKSNSTYIFTITVSSGSRQAQTTVQIFVASGNPPTVGITASSTTVSSKSRVQLSGSSMPGNVSYIWSETTNQLDLSIRENLLTSITNPNLVIKPNVLSPGATYSFLLTATNVNGTGQSSINIKVASAPYGGTCTVDPSQGSILDTTFTVSCQGWSDESADSLLYTFSYYLGTTEIVLANSQLSSSISTLLPSAIVGNSISIVAKVANKYGAVSSVNLTALVIKNNTSLNLNLIKNVLNNTLGNLNLYGDVDSGLSSLVALSSVIASANSSSSDVVALQTQIFQTFISAIPDQPTEEQVAKLSGNMAILAQGSANWEVTTKENLANYISTYAASSGSNTQALQDLTHGLSSLLASGTSSPSQTRRRQTAPEYANLVKNAISTISNSVVSGMLCGEDNADISSDNIQILAGRLMLDGNQNMQLELSNTQIVLPLTGSTLGGTIDLSSLDCLDTKISYQPNSIYTNTSGQFISQVLSINVGSNGEELDVNGLQSPFEIVIPIDPSQASCNSTNCTTSCQYLNETTNLWDTTGCETVSSNSSFVVCRCNHLTDFAAMLRSSASPLVDAGDKIRNSKNILSKLNEKPGPAIFIAVIIFIYLVCLFFGWWTDYKADRSVFYSDDLPTPKSITVSESAENAAAEEGRLTPTKRFLHESKWQRIKRKLKRRLTTNHRWICVFYRRKRDSFDRCKRITIVFNVAMTALACNAIFYEVRHQGTHLSAWQRFLTAFWSSLLIVPVNLLIFIFLYKSGTREESPVIKLQDMKEMNSDHPMLPGQSASTQSVQSTQSFEHSSDTGSSQELKKPKKKTRWQRFVAWMKRQQEEKWSWKWAVVGYILCFAVDFMSAYIVLLYTLDFVEQTVDGWVLSSVLTILQDIFLNQPVSNIVGAVFGSTLAGLSHKLANTFASLFRNCFNC